MGLAETAELAVRISLKDNVSAGVRGLQRNLTGLNGSLGRVGKGVGQIGTGFARAGLLVGGAAITGIGAAAKAAIDFEDAFAGVRKTVNQSELDKVGLTFDELAKSFRQMATEMPISAVELAKIGETAGALGVKAQDIATFTKTVATLGVTTNLTSEDAAEALGKVGTILNLTGSQITDFADVLVNLGNQGASTESEIIEVTKRFAAMGRQAGLTTPQILALSSAATSLGAEPEAAGSALSRIFSNMSTEIANATDKGKAFAEITGDSIATLRKRVNAGDALGILRETLEGLSRLSRTEGASMLKALGISNVRDRNAILLMSQNLGFVNDQLKIAENSSGALARETAIKFNTIAAKLTVLKNNLIESGIAIGEGMLPAIGRATDKLTKFLQDPASKGALAKLGEDIGEAIDKINWQAVLDGARSFVGVMKSALDFVLMILSALDKLPSQVKAAGAGFLVLNKLSGGLIATGVGNIAGGLAAGAASRLPGVGKLLAQPVFVTNWPLGGIGGAGGGGKAGGLAGKLGTGLAVATAAISIGEAVETYFAVNAATSAQATDVKRTLEVELASNPTTQTLTSNLAAINSGIAEIRSNPLYVFVQGDALTKLDQMRTETVTALGVATGTIRNADRWWSEAAASTTRTSDHVEAMRQALSVRMDNQSALERQVAERIESNRITTQAGLGAVTGATRDAALAIRAIDVKPVVNVTTNVRTSVSVSAIERGTITRRRASYDTSVVAS